jgi:hypothetical protein
LFAVPLLYPAFSLAGHPKKTRLAAPPIPTGGSAATGLVESLVAAANTRFGNDPALAFHPVFQDPDYRKLYTEGRSAFQRADWETAIRTFQALADAEPDVGLFNQYAAQALAEFMRYRGWDIGYMERAKRYLSRARRQLPTSRRLGQLEVILIDLDRGHE